MKLKILFSLVLFLFTLNAYTQIKSGNLTFRKNSSGTQNGSNLHLIERVGNSLMETHDRNVNSYYDFLNLALNSLDNDVNSINYKAQMNALENYKNTMQPYVSKKEAWSDATDDLLKAKAQYNEYIHLYIRNYSSYNNFLTMVENDLKAETDSLQYTVKVKLINGFKNSLSSYVFEIEPWSAAYKDIENAKKSFYNNLTISPNGSAYPSFE